MEKQLFPSREDEVNAAVNTLQNLVLEFHGELLPSARDSQAHGQCLSATVNRAGLSVPGFSCNSSAQVHPLGFGPPRVRVVTTVKLRHGRYEGPPPGLGKLRAAFRNSGPGRELVLLFTCLLAAALARQRFFHSFLFARLKVKGVTFHFLDNVLLLDFPLKTPQCVF